MVELATGLHIGTDMSNNSHGVSNDSGSPGPAGDRFHHLRHIVDHTAHLLPAQGPIGVFIHHNTLHAFQHLSFEEAVVEAAKVYGTEPYMSEDAYRREVGRGRIQIEDIDAVLADEPDAPVWGNWLRRRELRRRMLVPGLRRFTPETVRWELEEGRLVESSDGHEAAHRRLFSVCLAHTPLAPGPAEAPVRPRDAILQAGGPDLDDAVHPLLIRSAAAFTDQGIAYWPMPNREEGFLEAVRMMIRQPWCLRSPELITLAKRAESIDGTAEEVVCKALDALGIEEAGWEEFIRAELLALGGWAGMISRLEQEPELAPHERVPATLMDFLAVRLLLTLAALDSQVAASRLKHVKSWRTPAPAPDAGMAVNERLARAATLYDAAQQLGITAAQLEEASPAEVARLRDEIFDFNEIERRRVFHLAYERRHERQILLPLIEHSRRDPLPVPNRLAAQVFFCLDEREESIRRHLEEVAPEIETFAAAGFYGVAVNYTGIDDAHGAALCPVVVKPQHAVEERPANGHQSTYELRVRLRKLWAKLTREWYVSSRTLVRGWLGTTVLGVFSLVPMAARVLSPRRYSLLINWLNSSVLPEPRTELAFERSDAQGHAAAEGLMAGFTVEEKADRVAGVLGPAGLSKGMARLVLTLGHGSTSLNNPHESAHDCGACGGRRGGPNGRLFAAMANHPEVRKALRARNIQIPSDTWFVGGYHDTCNDNVDLYDLDAVPESHRADLAHVRAAIDKARARSAHERARRFEAADYGIDFEQGLNHVQERAEHMAEPRPEYGHCTNAVCIIGRRATTRGLFFDRRAFLVSYDVNQDPDDSSLARLLGAVIPVCAGISLEYYFSFVDNEGYGCGTKLPHNVTGLVGVMNGYESDLRTGLPWQMVEIHEPVRILFVVETTPERVLETIRNNPGNWEFLNNRWIRLAAQDPETGAIQMYRQTAAGASWEPVSGDDERLATAPSSAAWYQNKREHLPIARIEPAGEESRKMAVTQ